MQECENPKLIQHAAFNEWASNSLWIGSNKNKGLAIVAKSHIKLTLLDWDSSNLQLFLPCLINDEFLLLAIWTKQANSPNFQYIGQIWKYLQLHSDKFINPKTILIGDWNSNTRWDEWDRWWNHSDVVKLLGEVGIQSIYHYQNNEAQGSEKNPTFYMNRNLEKSYHIDYAFLSNDLLQPANVSIGNPSEWLQFSDHMPVIVSI